MNRGCVLFVDDEEQLRTSAAEWLSLSGFQVTTADSVDTAESMLAERPCDVVVTDLRMPLRDGMALLDASGRRDPDLPVVMLTGHGDVSAAVEAMHRGAHDFLEKPYDADHLVVVLDRAVRQRRLSMELARLRAAVGDRRAIEDRLVGVSSAIGELRDRVLQLAGIDVDVLVVGETGTGKEIVARALHDLGPRASGNFVAINCAAVPEAVFESEIFGHARGAFTGASVERVGKFAHAHGGTVFLDEIESMPPALQAKVLRAIQERVVEPLGGNRQSAIDVRFVAASKVDLRAESESGRFRPDLYYRLSTVELTIPPLRDRRDDIALLYRSFLGDAERRFNVTAPPVTPAALADLADRPWPGNIRELKAHAERAALSLHRPGRSAAPAANLSLPDEVARFEARCIREALEVAEWSTAVVAERLGIPRRTLNEKIARYGLKRSG
jgi:two-component system C4-dicarboxylate transport response regulator DctD